MQIHLPRSLDMFNELPSGLYGGGEKAAYYQRELSGKKYYSGGEMHPSTVVLNPMTI
jgi:hypothetical protein